MKFPETSAIRPAPVVSPWGCQREHRRKSAFTLTEVMVVAALLTILIISGFRGILSIRLNSARLTDYTSGMAIVEAKVEDIRAVKYNPPNYPFGTSTIYVTNNSAVALNKAGASFMISGTVVSKIEPVVSGHLVTVTGTFNAPGKVKPITVSLQTVVNKYSGGQQ